MLAVEFGNTAVLAADKVGLEGNARHVGTAGLADMDFAADTAGLGSTVGLADDAVVVTPGSIAHLERNVEVADTVAAGMADSADIGDLVERIENDDIVEAVGRVETIESPWSENLLCPRQPDDLWLQSGLREFLNRFTAGPESVGKHS